MRKTILTVFVLALMWVAYAAWPFFDLFKIVRAIETRDVAVVSRHVDFTSVRQSLTKQIMEAYIRRTGLHISPLVQNIISATSIADPIVAKLISPEALAMLLNIGWPITVLPNPPPNTVGISSDTVGTIWQILMSSDYGFGRFNVSLPAPFPKPQRFGLEFRLAQWRWQLVGAGMPENIQNLLADELIKLTKVPSQNHPQ